MLQRRGSGTPVLDVRQEVLNRINKVACNTLGVLHEVIRNHSAELGDSLRLVLENTRYDSGDLPRTVRTGELPANAVGIHVIYETASRHSALSDVWYTVGGQEIRGVYLFTLYFPFAGGCVLVKFQNTICATERSRKIEMFGPALNGAIVVLMELRRSQLGL